jgi:hypothetical protein
MLRNDYLTKCWRVVKRNDRLIDSLFSSLACLQQLAVETRKSGRFSEGRSVGVELPGILLWWVSIQFFFFVLCGHFMSLFASEF